MIKVCEICIYMTASYMHVLRFLALAAPLCVLSQSQDFAALHCVACEAGFFRTQHTKTCTACPEGSGTFHYTNATSALDCLCNPGFENKTHACEMCSREHFKDVLENRSCTECHANSQSLTPGASAQELCKCNPGFFAVPRDGSTVCTACESGTYKENISDALCVACPQDHYCPEQANETQPCPLHSLSAPASSRVEDCLCTAGFYSAYTTGEYACHACTPGTYGDSAGQSSCTLCPVNTYNPEFMRTDVGQCLSCASNAESPQGSVAQVNCTCNLGYAGVPGDSCTACAAGKYRKNEYLYICDLCPANTFSPLLASDSDSQCVSCRANSSSNAGSGGERDCVCNPGHYGDSCTPCAAGTFTPHFNSSTCIACEPGKFSASVGAATGDACLECRAGTYTAEGGMTSCVECPHSTWQNTSLPGARARECAECPAQSSHAETGVTDVLACVCTTGFWKHAAPPGFQCRECLPGHFCPGLDALVPCAFNTFSAGAAVTSCTACAPLSSATANASLTGPEQCQCIRGTSGAFHDSCTPCDVGHFQAGDHVYGGADSWPAELRMQEESGGTVGAPAAQPTVCVVCAKHTFQNASGSSACHACPLHSSTRNNASTQATDCTCDPGYFGVSGDSCAECEANHFCPGVFGTEMNPCRVHTETGPRAKSEDDCKCIAGFYGSHAGAPCQLCPTASYCPGDLAVLPCANLSSSTPGSQSIAACECLPGHWRGCTKDATGVLVDKDGVPCSIDYASACVKCEANDVCFNETLMHCPLHSTAAPGSDEARDCVCEPGFLGLYGG